MRTIAFLTDFGTASPFVGIMKAVAHRLAPESAFIDINNEIPPGDIKKAAFELFIAEEYFENSIILCVVDPGVGSKRKILAAKTGKNFVLAPDNGLLSLLISEKKVREIREVSNKKYFLKKNLTTFDGRDVFAPVGAALSRRVSFSILGKKLKPQEIVLFEVPTPKFHGKKVFCEIVYIDSFGNCWTNLKKGNFIPERGEGKAIVRKFAASYSGSSPIMLFNSFDFLELAIPRGNFAAKYKIRVGDKFVLR